VTPEGAFRNSNLTSDRCYSVWSHTQVLQSNDIFAGISDLSLL